MCRITPNMDDASVMTMAGNTNLGAAKAAKNDEFYTQWNDIENEMQAYLAYDPDVFRGKVVLLPCDDPGASNFTKYFALNFERFGLKKLISTSYAPASNPAVTAKGQTLLNFELGEDQDEKFNEDDTWYRGRIYVLEQGSDLNDDGKLNKEDLRWDYLQGDGDFRSEEVTKLRDEADIVITNPPFSLFREFLAWLVKGHLKFSIIGNSNAITYKEVFPPIRDNEMWLGATGNTTDMVFRVPEGTEVKESDKAKAARLGYPSTATETYTRLGNSCWFTNIEHGRRHEPLVLMTMEDNLIYGSKRVQSIGYPKYGNYDAVEVPETKAIPSDYDGVMGVPISFLDKYSPEQFEIVGRDGDLDLAVDYPFFTPPPKEEQMAHRKRNVTWRVQNCYLLDEEGVAHTIYKRIFIRHRRPEAKES